MILRVSAVIFFLFAFAPVSVYADRGRLAEEFQVNLYRARVVEVADEIVIRDTVTQVLRVRVLNRDLRGHETTVRNTLAYDATNRPLRSGNRIVLHMEEDADGTPVFFFYGYDRLVPFAVLFAFFAACVVALGGLKGVRALTALLLTIMLIMFVLVPLLLRGYNPIVLSVVVCVLSTIITCVICFGTGKKSFSAVLGVSGGLLIGGVIAHVFGIAARMAGLSHGDAQMLQYLPGGYMFDFRGLLFAGIIIGALGACLDVAISISSALTEITAHNPSAEKKEIVRSGFNIGKDIMGSMINTLILAYTGGSLATILIFAGFGSGLSQIFNLESIAVEILRSVAGSLGLIFAIPITIFAFVFLDKMKGRNT
ncbi:MAG: YibE/F family protein [Defluviitaleaceae bacterium]|nr:YibE/F family protein [Defluviitaleaceae bacterium]MCL2262432.1 YibE/F family protein [Defluviitaleaceae bacterium]